MHNAGFCNATAIIGLAFTAGTSNDDVTNCKCDDLLTRRHHTLMKGYVYIGYVLSSIGREQNTQTCHLPTFSAQLQLKHKMYINAHTVQTLEGKGKCTIQRIQFTIMGTL